MIIALLCASAMLFTGCSNEVRNIPDGYIAKKLAPTGFENGILNPGQCDIGEKASNGQYTTLILLESSTITIKEEFHQKDPKGDNEDHRIMTKKTPLTVDVYIQVALPTDEKLRDAAFSSMTPTPWANETRMSVITLGDIYKKFAQLTVRGKCRGIFTHYENYDSVMAHFDKINAECFASIIQIFKSSSTPLTVIDAQISNVKEDEEIWKSKNELEAAKTKAAAIDIVNAAMRRNPNYIEARQWDVIEKGFTSSNPPSMTFIMSDKSSMNYTLPVTSSTKK